MVSIIFPRPLQDLERNLAGNIDDKALGDEIADDDDEAIALVRIKSISVDREASKVREAGQPAMGAPSEKVEDPLIEGDSPSPLANDSTKQTMFEASASVEEKTPSRFKKNGDPALPSRYSLQEDPFHKSRVPRKSVLKKCEHPIRRAPSTYDSTHSPSISPQSTSPEVPRSPSQHGQKCCVVM